ncbi:MAG: hypothetical protein JOZ66_16370 [Hyphomicrobiales bacterium]|nr:hypothetical protein [Hyphomicrobiales bacterium]
MTNGFSRPPGSGRRAVLGTAFALAGLASCISPESQLASDKTQCETQGLSPSTNAFEDCLAEANSRRRDTQARQAVRMRELQDLSMENFLHSQSAAP